jgi:16S rRNA (guanine966-N2)-methyltransferase
VRVIAGKLGGRRLVAPSGMATRPTGERVREALFSILADVTDTRVLDLYAGTGALGIEALSRGAARAVFVETATPAAAALKQNIATLGLQASTRVIIARAEKAAQPIVRAGPYDLVLVDPPWVDVPKAAAVLNRLVAEKAFAPEARVVLEHSASEPAPRLAAAIEIVDARRYGDTGIVIGRVTG